MAIGFVASSFYASTNGSAITTQASQDSTGANFLVACLVDYDAVGASTFSDSKSNTWTVLTAKSNSSRTRLVYTYNATVGSGHTFSTANASTAYPAITVLSFSGVQSASDPFDQQTGTINSTTAGAITPAGDNYLVIAGHGENTVTSTSIGGGFSTPIVAGAVSGGAFFSAISYLIQTTATSANPAWADATDSAVLASFKIASAGGATAPHFLGLLGAGA